MTEALLAPQDLTHPAFDVHLGGKLEIRGRVAIESREDLARAYTPGFAYVAAAIQRDPALLVVCLSLFFQKTKTGRALRAVAEGGRVLFVDRADFVAEVAADHRREEIARMLGGVEITATTRKHAREMLAL